VKKCVEEKKLKCCGECKDFPCSLLKIYSCDKDYGDNGIRIESCAK